MQTEESSPAFATNCHVGPDFVPCDPVDLLPLIRRLEEDQETTDTIMFPRGALLPVGRLDLCKQGIGAAGAQAVTTALRGNRHVQHLLFGADGLGDAGACAVAEL